jgi:hypothetical protein
MIVINSDTNERTTEKISGYKTKTEALHSGFDYFEKVFWAKKDIIGY